MKLKIYSIVLSFFLFSFIVLLPVSVFAQDTIDLTPAADYTSLVTLTPSMYVAAAVTILLGLAGVLAFVFLLIGGIQWITAGGDKDAVQKAQRKVVQALVGLAIVFSAYAILYVIRVLFQINAVQITLQSLQSY